VSRHPRAPRSGGRLRVALLHPYAWPAVRRGGERYLADLAWYLASRGHRVEVVTGPGADPPAPEVVLRPARPPRPGALARRGVTEVETFGLAALPRLLRRHDVVHALVPSAALAARLAGQRTLYTVLGYPTPELVARFPRAQRALLRRAVRMAHVCAALSASAADAVRRTFGRADVAVLSPGVRLDVFAPDLRPRAGPPRVLFPAYAANPHKGLPVLLGAFATLLRRFPDARLELAGPGDASWALVAADPAVRAAVAPLGPGTLDDLPARYRAATVTALPSTYEAFGLVLVESLASGTPVVCATTASGAGEVVSSPAVGRIVPFGDAEALARALEETILLARDPATPARCREHARRFGWEEAVGPAHEALYLALAGRSR
jgi:phosphatidylinositol alpha-mannosyltransferase